MEEGLDDAGSFRINGNVINLGLPRCCPGGGLVQLSVNPLKPLTPWKGVRVPL